MHRSVAAAISFYARKWNFYFSLNGVFKRCSRICQMFLCNRKKNSSKRNFKSIECTFCVILDSKLRVVVHTFQNCYLFLKGNKFCDHFVIRCIENYLINNCIMQKYDKMWIDQNLKEYQFVMWSNTCSKEIVLF